MQARLSDWSRWIFEPTRILDGTTAEQACDFVNRYVDDIELLDSLKLNAFRISLNWPALMQEAPGSSIQLDKEAMEYYRRVLQTLKDKGITTFVTLFHFCLPSWLADRGGWLSRDTAHEFSRFTAEIADSLGDLIDYWLTINEPMAYVYQSYVSGQWTPGLKNDYIAAFTALRHILDGHARAYTAIKSRLPNAPVSFTNHWRPFFPENPINPLDHWVAYLRDQVFNQIFPKSIKTGRLEFPAPLGFYRRINELEGEIENLKDSMDYLGVNYYTRELSRFKMALPLDIFGETSPTIHFPTNALGWEIYPQGLYHVLTDAIRPYLNGPDGKPREVFVTENGYADVFDSKLSEGDWSLDDHKRVNFLISHLEALHDAIKAGVNVRGYLHWSLIDNFEWAEGLSPRFGLIRVSYPNQSRMLRKSASIYAQIAAKNSIFPDLINAAQTIDEQG